MTTTKTITHTAAALMAVFIGLNSGHANAQPILTFTDVIVPGGINPAAIGINNAGTIVGVYGVEGDPNFWAGFIDRKGVFTDVILPPPASTISQLTGINDAGVAVGQNFGFDGTMQSFLRTAHGNILYPPEATTSGPNPFTWLIHNNNQGDVVGETGSDFGGNSSPPHGCVLHDGHYSLFDFPGAVGTVGMGINDHGDIVGWYQNATGLAHGFLKRGDIYTTIDFPGADFTNLMDINDKGQIVGAYGSVSDYTWHGFLLSDGVFTTVDFPGEEESGNIVWSINDEGNAVGWYANGNGGFLVNIAPPKNVKHKQ